MLLAHPVCSVNVPGYVMALPKFKCKAFVSEIPKKSAKCSAQGGHLKLLMSAVKGLRKLWPLKVGNADLYLRLPTPRNSL